MKISILRRISQILVLLLFILGNFGFVKILSGNLSSSLLFGKIHLSDPFAVLQMFLAGMSVASGAILGALVIFVFYSIIAPRAFCSFVCPVNLITDFANFIRKKFGYSKQTKVLNISKNIRYYLLALFLILSFVLKTLAFENVNHIAIFTRHIIALSGFAFMIAICIFSFDCFILERGICGHLCPVGAFYALISKFSFIRVKHDKEKCSACMKCKMVCPENQILKMVSKESFYVGSECISCARCIEACEDNALEFSIRDLRRNK